MSSIASKLPAKALVRLLTVASRPLLVRSLSTVSEERTQKLERIADEMLDLTKIERHDYAILFRLKMGLNKYGPAVSGLSAPGSAAAGSASAEAKEAEKTVFDIKLEKFDAAAKIKIIKEVRTFTSLGLKEAKDLVEKVPVVLKKGVTKDQGNPIIEKLKELGATAKRFDQQFSCPLFSKTAIMFNLAYTCWTHHSSQDVSSFGCSVSK